MAFNALKKVMTIKNEKGIGAPAMCTWQRGSGNYIAIRFEGIQAIFIYDRHAKLYKKIAIPSNCTGLEWDADGDVLAIMIDTAGLFVLWEAHSSKIYEIETGFKDTGTVICWSGAAKILAYGTLKGNTLVYNHRNMRKIPVVGKHLKKIVCAAWSKDEMLAFATLDDQVSLNTPEADLIKYLPLRGKPSDLQFGQIKEDNAPNSTADNTVSCLVGEKTLFMVKFDDQTSTSPMELGFQTRYGNLLSHHWHGDGYILVSFTAGFIVLLSSHYKEIGTELVLVELKDDIVRHCSMNVKRGWLAVCCGQSTIQIHNASDPKVTLSLTEIQDEDGRLRPLVRCDWTDDGQLLAVSNTAGDVGIYLTSVPMMGGANYNQLAAMSSLTDCVLYNFTGGQIVPEFTYTLQIEPSMIVLGPLHLAAVVHSSVWLFNTRGELASLASTPTYTKEFNSNVQEFVLNHAYCAARCGDRAYLHRIDGDGLGKRDVKTFPETSAKGFRISCIAMPKEVFMYAGDNGVVKIFHTDRWTEVLSVEAPTQAPIKGLYPDPTGGQCVVVDKHNTGFYFDVLTPSGNDGNFTVIRKIPDFPNRCNGVYWDIDFNSRHIFLSYCDNDTKVHLFSAWRDVAKGVELQCVGQYEVFKSAEYRPVCYRKGIVYVFTGTGKIMKCLSMYQEKLDTGVPNDNENILKRLVTLRQFNEALEYCGRHPKPENWTFLAKAAVETAQLDIAMQAYTALKDVGMVYCLRRMQEEAEDVNILLGDVALLGGNFDLAEVKYLEAGKKEKALTLRRDLQDWEKAMDMAEKFRSPSAVDIALEYASAEEFRGDYLSALSLFKRAQTISVKDNGIPHDKNVSILKGMARNLIRTGRSSDAMDPINQLEDDDFCFESAKILEDSKEYAKAAKLYVKCNRELEAASCYIRLKDYDLASTILNNINVKEVNRKYGNTDMRRREIWKQYGKAREVDGFLMEAARAYADSQDSVNGIRLFLQLGIPEEAGALAQLSDDRQDMIKVAMYYLEQDTEKDLERALTYFIMSESYDEALFSAFKYGCTEYYMDYVYHYFDHEIPDGFLNGVLKIADDYVGKRDYYRAGKGYMYAGIYDKAFSLLMKCVESQVHPEEEKVIELMIDVVLNANSDKKTQQMIDLFLGEKDGIPKDPKYLFNYYLAAGKIQEASTTAMIVSKAEQNTGNYREAHRSIVTAMIELRRENYKYTKEMIDLFNILHSYKLLRLFIQRSEMVSSARLSIRICDNLSQFPKVAVEILTTGVTLCRNANMKESARQMAFRLVKNAEYREAIDAKYRQFIEQMVRKLGKVECVDEPDSQTTCPYCDELIDDYSLKCNGCKSIIPLCIVTGKHIDGADLSACPRCDFPYNLSELTVRFPELVNQCPICEHSFHHDDLKRINDPRPYLYDNVVNPNMYPSTFLNSGSTTTTNSASTSKAPVNRSTTSGYETDRSLE